MIENDETYNKQRIVGYNGAMFSIAMKVIVLEVVVPSYKELKTSDTLFILKNRIPDFIGLVVTFLVTAIHWMADMRIIKFASTIDCRILWYNILPFYFIVLFPFSMAFYVKGFSSEVPFIFYCFNVSAIVFCDFILNVFIPKKENRKTGLTSALTKYFRLRAFNAFIIWVIVGFLAFYVPMVACFLFLLIFLVEFIMIKIYKKKLLKKAHFES